MAVERLVKGPARSPQIVGVIASVEELRRAVRMRRSPDLFELRLDALAASEVVDAVPMLRAPLIITARHPAEGGLNNLSVTRRRAVLLQFLPGARYVDIELRSAVALRAVSDTAIATKVKRIISVHAFAGTPELGRLHQLARAAEAHGADIFKIVTRTDTWKDLDRLAEFFDNTKGRMTISAMGVGVLGRASRSLFAQRGSVLNYVHLGTARTEGQLSLAEMRRLLQRSR